VDFRSSPIQPLTHFKGGIGYEIVAARIEHLHFIYQAFADACNNTSIVCGTALSILPVAEMIVHGPCCSRRCRPVRRERVVGVWMINSSWTARMRPFTPAPPVPWSLH